MPLNNKPVSYLQTDSRWASWPYSNKDENTNIAKSGCGPTAMAMVIATWADSSVTPVTTCQWALNHGYKATGNGTYHSYFVPQAAAYGLECYRVNTSSIAYMSTSNANKYHQEAHDAVDEGHLVICLMSKGNWTSGGHYILWYSNDGDDVLINDPNSTKSTRVRNKWSLLKSQVRYYWVVKVPEEVVSMTNSEVESLISQKITAAISPTGTVPSNYARDGWFSACMAGCFDGSNPKKLITREQISVVLNRLGVTPQLTCPEDADFSQVVPGKFKTTLITSANLDDML